MKYQANPVIVDELADKQAREMDRRLKENGTLYRPWDDK